MPSSKPLDPGDIGVTRDEMERVAAWWTRRPLELEIGSGKGTFLVREAHEHPDVTYLGVEYAKEYWRIAADRVRRHGLTNVRLIYHDAVDVLRLHVPDASLRCVHLYFPDPWPKARHHKRRFFCEANLHTLHAKLEPGGRLRVATDHADYFAWMQEHADRCADRFTREPFTSTLGSQELVGTNFERKYRVEGRSFHGMVLVKKGV